MRQGQTHLFWSRTTTLRKEPGMLRYGKQHTEQMVECSYTVADTHKCTAQLHTILIYICPPLLALLALSPGS